MPQAPRDDVLPSIAEVRHDVRRLDVVDPVTLLAPPVRIVSNMAWDDLRIPLTVRTIAPGTGWQRFLKRLGSSLPGRLVGLATDLWFAWRLLRASFSHRTVLLVEAEREAVLCCFLSSFLRRGPGPIVLFGFHLHRYGKLKSRMIRRAIGAAAVNVTWSNKQSELNSGALDLPIDSFVCVPFKSNHSGKPDRPALDLGPYVFAGGNSERDYETLFEAVDGLDVPVVVSATDPSVLGDREVPDNVLLTAIREPFFGQAMASAALIVVPLTAGRVRGAGEGTILDGMWYGHPVICCDDVASPEYLDEGVDGWTVPPGDAQALRDRIVEAFADPERLVTMGQAARAKVEDGYTHERFRERLLKLACLVGRER